MKAIFKLIRLPNLLIIALTLYFTRYFLLRPLIELSGAEMQLSDLDFFLLNISIITIAAAGYIINDYFDTRIDFINKPEHVVIDKKVNRKKAILWHIILNVFGVLIAVYLAIRVAFPKLALIHILTVGLLWFYSTNFKRMFFIGNLIVALLSGIIPMLVVLFEPERILFTPYFRTNLNYNIAYALFAFVVSLIREIIKDMEDVKGDAAVNCKTIPVVVGIEITRYFTLFLSLIVMFTLSYIQREQYQSHDYISFWYFTIAIQLPLAAVIYFLIRAQSPRMFHIASTLTKVTMLGGIVSMYVFYYTQLV